MPSPPRYRWQTRPAFLVYDVAREEVVAEVGEIRRMLAPCPACGAWVDCEANYCSGCGERMTPPVRGLEESA